MQIYEPLVKWFDLVGIGTKKSVNDISGINFPIIKLYCPSQYISILPKFLPFMLSITGDTQWLLGFYKAVAGYDIIHSVELSNAYTLQAVRAKRKGLVKAVTVTVYENIPFLLAEYEARRKLKKEVIEHVDHFLAANNKAKDALLAEGVDEDKISIVPQSVDTHVFHPAARSDQERLEKLRNKFKIEKDDFVVLGVARLVWEKGWYDVVRAAYEVQSSSRQSRDKVQSKKRIVFLCIGDGSEREKLTKLVYQLNLEDYVKFAGNIPYQQIPDIFRLVDVFVHASIPIRTWNEQFGGVLIEAMASGLPVVATLCGGIQETVDKGGIFVQPQDFSEIAKGIMTFLANPSLRKEIGMRNRKTAIEKFDIEIVAHKIKHIWNKF